MQDHRAVGPLDLPSFFDFDGEPTTTPPPRPRLTRARTSDWSYRFIIMGGNPEQPRKPPKRAKGLEPSTFTLAT